MKSIALEKDSIVNCDETWCKVRKYITIKKEHRLRIISSKGNFEENILSLLNNDTFVNYTVLVPNFLDWEEFSDLEQVLGEQIRIIEAKYK